MKMTKIELFLGTDHCLNNVTVKIVNDRFLLFEKNSIICTNFSCVVCVCGCVYVCVCVHLPIVIHTPHSVLLETVPFELVAHDNVVVDDVTLIARFVPRKVTTYQNSKILYYKNAFQ